jgi:hypothetical protein
MLIAVFIGMLLWDLTGAFIVGIIGGVLILRHRLAAGEVDLIDAGGGNDE